MSQPTADAVADIVLARLKPILEDIAKRLPEEGELAAINAGIAASLEMSAAIGELVKKLDAATHNLADNQMTIVEEIRGYHSNTIDAYDRLGKRVHALEEWRKRVENDGTRLVETGGE